ncbi:MAG: oxidoreductase [Promethearchaeota archaeon CR_4]|nr:MAG: oxidoreductase [Candidatus Lokiarchaeota archaeon CR_4]
MKKKNTAVIGTGWFGRAHARNYAQESTLVAICDVNEALAQNVAKQYDNVHAYNDVEQMIKNEKIEAVSIVTPPSEIPRLTEICAKAGISVLMEKPLGLDLESVQKLRQYDNVRIQPGFIELYNPVIEELQKHLPEIGEVLTISSKRIGLFPRRHWGMGVVLDLATHDVYLQQHFLGAVQDVGAMLRYFYSEQYEDAAYILLNFGKSKGSIESNWLTPTKYRRMFVCGSEGSIEVDFITQEVHILHGSDLTGDNPRTIDTCVQPLRQEEPLRKEILNFLNDKVPRVTLEDGIKTMEVVLKILNIGGSRKS